MDSGSVCVGRNIAGGTLPRLSFWSLLVYSCSCNSVISRTCSRERIHSVTPARLGRRPKRRLRRGFKPSYENYFEGAGGASLFHVSRTASHFPFVLRQVARNLPAHTVTPSAVVSLDVPADQPMLPDTATV